MVLEACQWESGGQLLGSLALWAALSPSLVLGLLLGALVAGWLAWRFGRPRAAHFRRREFDRARPEFHPQRERLEARFLQLAASSGKPRGLDWSDCEFADDVVYAWQRETGELAALVSVSISFTAIEGGGMEEVEAVSNVRAATAVFQHQNHHWNTQGRTIFNLNPTEAVKHFHGQLELVAIDPGQGGDSGAREHL